jgi:hypothetical protein
MKYLVIDAALHGTGIRDYFAGGYIEPESLKLSSGLIKRLNDWSLLYEDEHYNGFSNKKLIDDLDCEGKNIAYVIKEELSDVKIDYFSAVKMLK